MFKQIKHKQLVERIHINRKYRNEGTRGIAIPEDQQIFKKVAPEPYRRLGNRSYRTRLAKSVSKMRF